MSAFKSISEGLKKVYESPASKMRSLMALRDHPNTSAAERAAAVAGIARIKAANPTPTSAKSETPSNFRDFAHTSLVFRAYLRGKIPNEKLKSTAAALAEKHPEVDMTTPENVVRGHIKKHLG